MNGTQQTLPRHVIRCCFFIEACFRLVASLKLVVICSSLRTIWGTAFFPLLNFEASWNTKLF